MNTELVKVIEVLEVLNTHTGNIFINLSSKERLQLATKIHAVSPGSDVAALVTSIIAIYRDIDSYNSGAFSDMSLFDKLSLACDIRKQETGGNAVGEPVEAVAGVAASATFTVGGETDSDIAEDDTITIGNITLTAVANDATPGDYEFCIDDDKDTVIENIIACIDAIPGNSVIPWTAEAGTTPTIIFTAKETGTAWESIEVSVETEGDSAFSRETFEGGVDEVEATEGYVGRVTVDGTKVYVNTQTGFRQVDTLLPIKIVKKTIGGVGVANCDYNFETAENDSEQSINIEVGAPTHGGLVYVYTHTNSTFTGAVSLAVTAGVEAADDSIIASGAAFTADSILVSDPFPTVPSLAAEAPIYINATPGADWELVTAGKMTVYVIYFDVANV